MCSVLQPSMEANTVCLKLTYNLECCPEHDWQVSIAYTVYCVAHYKGRNICAVRFPQTMAWMIIPRWHRSTQPDGRDLSKDLGGRYFPLDSLVNSVSNGIHSFQEGLLQATANWLPIWAYGYQLIPWTSQLVRSIIKMHDSRLPTCCCYDGWGHQLLTAPPHTVHHWEKVPPEGFSVHFLHNRRWCSSLISFLTIPLFHCFY